MDRDLTQQAHLPVEDIQGDILVGLLKRHEHLMFFHITNKDQFKTFLKTLHITSAKECLDQQRAIAAGKARHEKTLIPIPGLNLALTPKGMAILGVPSLPAGAAKAFQRGMAASQAALADPPAHTWKILQPSERLHGVFILARASHAEMLDIIASRLAPSAANGFEILHEEIGQVRPGPVKGLEDFGYVDRGIRGTAASGIGLMSSLRADRDQANPEQELLWPGEFVFCYPGQNPAGPDLKTTGNVEQPPSRRMPGWW